MERDLEQQLIKKFNMCLRIECIILVLYTSLCIVYTIMVGEPIVLLIYWGIEIFLIIRMIPEIKDLWLVKARSFEKVVGEVIKYEKDGISARTTHYYPIIRNEITGEEIKLDVYIDENDKGTVFRPPATGIGEKYTFLYLKNTKWAVCKREPKSYGEEAPD